MGNVWSCVLKMSCTCCRSCSEENNLEAVKNRTFTQAAVQCEFDCCQHQRNGNFEGKRNSYSKEGSPLQNTNSDENVDVIDRGVPNTTKSPNTIEIYNRTCSSNPMQNTGLLPMENRDEQNICGEGQNAGLVSTTSLLQNYNMEFNLTLNNPSNVQIGSNNTVNDCQIQPDILRSKSVEYFRSIGQDTKFIRRHIDEILRNQQDIKKNGAGASFRKTTLRKGSFRSKRCKSLMFNRPRLNTKSNRSNSLKNDSKTHGLLKDMEWQQYEVVQNAILRTGSCRMKKCRSPRESEEEMESFKTNIRNILDKTTKELERRFLRSSVVRSRIHDKQSVCSDWREKSITNLKKNCTSILRQADVQLLRMKDNRIRDIEQAVTNSFTQKCDGQKTSESIVRENAESFIKKITDSTIQYVSTLLPLLIQEQIIKFTFECQKSFVIKEMMIDFINNNFADCIKYILNPNEYAKLWLTNYTKNKLFKRKNGSHLYADLAKKEIKTIFLKIKEFVDLPDSRNGSNNISLWITSFLDYGVLQIFNNEFEDLQNIENVNDEIKFTSFISILKHRLDNMEQGVLQKFKQTTSENVQWSDDPYDKIVEHLWGCKHCCPFCREPCQYSDPDHVEQGFPHRCIQHRPLGVYGFMDNNTHKLVTEHCNYLVQTDLGYKFKDEENLRPCKDYIMEFSDWNIVPSKCINEPKYWIWVMQGFKEDLCKLYRANMPDIPTEWDDVTPQEAADVVDSVYICS